jgi:hypothetical protein
MNAPSHDFVTVDMRGLKAALVVRARADRTTVSVLVRTAVARLLGLDETAASGEAEVLIEVRPTSVKLSIRLTTEEAKQLVAAARAQGLSRGAYLAGLVAGGPLVWGGPSRAEHLAALIASTAELPSLSRNIRHLTVLLSQGEVAAARAYREMLDTLDGDVRRHLKLASGVLADLRSRRRGAGSLTQPHV